MLNKYCILQIIILSLAYINITYGRVVYILAHAEKPGEGILDKEGEIKISSMDGLGFREDGLGYTGMLRAKCMMDNFGPEAPYYRRPKRIITQHFILQNNGDFINNGKRGHHTSRRMYHQTYALALALGIDPDEELCCGGSFDDILKYIYTLPKEDDPILIVNQHGVCNQFIKAFALSYGKPAISEDFGKVADRIWTMVDGEKVEEWSLCCPAIKQCAPQQQPSWVTDTVPVQSPQKPPLKKGVEYPSFIFTPSNVQNDIGWNFSSYLRKRGYWSGEECFNKDIVTPYKNVTDFDLRNTENRVEASKNEKENAKNNS